MVFMAETNDTKAKKVKAIKTKPKKITKDQPQLIIVGPQEKLETIKAVILSHLNVGDVRIMEGKK